MIADDLPVVIDRSSGTAISVQVADALRDAATHGRVRVGDRLPSSRALATRIGVSRTVTAAAYDQLHAEGWVAGRTGSGTYVTAAPATPVAAPRPSTDTVAQRTAIDLTPGSPCLDALDRAAWRRAWRAAGDRAPDVYKHRAGTPEFRAAVAEHLLRHRGLATTVPVVATSGTSSATGELVRALLPPGASIAVENPGYGRAIGELRAAGMRIVPVAVDADGLCIDAVPTSVSAVYCTPAHQFPMGARMPAARRVALVELARRHGWLIIEDDYDGELRFDSAPLPLLATIGPDVVAHLGTASKILTPTLGIGWLAAAEHVTDAVVAHRERTGTGPAVAGQSVLAEFAGSGDLARHLRRIRRLVSARRTEVMTVFARSSIEVVGDDAGAHVVLRLPGAEAEASVVAGAARRGIRLDGLARHHVGTPLVHGITLGYTACSPDELTVALPQVAALVQA